MAVVLATMICHRHLRDHPLHRRLEDSRGRPKSGLLMRLTVNLCLFSSAERRQPHIGLPPVPDLCHAVPCALTTSPGTPNVPDVKACSLLSSGNTAVQSCRHCNWQISSVFIAKLQMYRVQRPTNDCHQIAQKCTKSHTEFQKFSGRDTPGRPSAGGSAPDPRPGLGK